MRLSRRLQPCTFLQIDNVHPAPVCRTLLYPVYSPVPTSTGMGEACRASNTLLLVDSVCTLGGAPLFCDAWGVDCTYAGSQKCLSAPPGAFVGIEIVLMPGGLSVCEVL